MPAVLASDNFNRANINPIGAPWISLGLPTYIPGEIVSNQFTGVPGAGGGDSLYDGGISWPSDQFSQATLRTLTVFTSLAILWVRATPGNGVTDGNAYGFEINSGTGGGGFGVPTQIAIFVQIGSAVSILATGTIVPQAGDVYRFQAVGQTINAFRNGLQILQATDSQVATGKPGLGAEVDSITENVAWDDWSGGVAVNPCTVTGNLQTLTANQIAQGRINFQLTNTGIGNPIGISGTSLFPALVYSVLSAPDGSFSVALWGNDNINPSNTLYAVTFRDSQGNEMGPVLFSITGASVNLNSASPISNILPPVFAGVGTAGAVLLSPGTPQTISGQPLTLASTAPLNVQGVINSATITANDGVSPNFVTLDFRGTIVPSDLVLGKTIAYNVTTPGNTDSMVRSQMTASIIPGGTGSIVSHYMLTSLFNSAAGGSTVDGASTEGQVTGTLGGTLAHLNGDESVASILSTGSSVGQAAGVTGAVFSTVGSTTAVTQAFGVKGIGCSGQISGAAPSQCYGGYFNAQHEASGRNYSFASEGKSIFMYDAVVGKSGFDMEDAANSPHPTLFIDNTSSLILEAPGVNGTFFVDNTGAVKQNITSAGTKFNTGLSNNGSGFKHIRFAGNLGGTCPTAAAIGAPCTSGNISWGTAFADNNYTVSCTLNGAMTGQPHIVSTSYQAAGAGITLTIAADSAVAANVAPTGFVDCVAVHD